MTLGRAIKLFRVNSGLKQKELAHELGVSANYLSLVENDKREPSISFLKDLAKTINVPVGVLLLDVGTDTSYLTEEENSIFFRIQELVLEIERLRASRRAQRPFE